MKSRTSLTLFVLAAFLLSSCGQLFTSPTPTPLPTNTPTLTPKPTFTPTITPTITPTPTSTPVVPLGKREDVPWGGFSFRPPEGYMVEKGAYKATLYSPDLSLIFMMMGQPNVDELSLDELIAESSDPNSEGPVTLNDTVPVADENGVILTMDMGLFKMNMVLALPKNEKQVFTATSMSFSLMGGGESSGDKPDAEAIVAEILRTVEFTEIPEDAYIPRISPDTCQVATDKSYGLSKDNPVLLAGYPFDNRVEAFFEIIAGPKGETVSFEEPEILSQTTLGEQEPAEYIVTYLGQKKQIVFYILEYELGEDETYEQPFVPIGFTCKQP